MAHPTGQRTAQGRGTRLVVLLAASASWMALLFVLGNSGWRLGVIVLAMSGVTVALGAVVGDWFVLWLPVLVLAALQCYGLLFAPSGGDIGGDSTWQQGVLLGLVLVMAVDTVLALGVLARKASTA